MKKITVKGDIPSIDTICSTLASKMRGYEVRRGWGIVKWCLVKKSFYVGIHTSIDEQQRAIKIERWFGSPLAYFLGGALFMLIFPAPWKGAETEVYDCLNGIYS